VNNPNPATIGLTSDHDGTSTLNGGNAPSIERRAYTTRE
jgi:hypothetical protein